MKTRFLLDAGPLVALLDARDQWHVWSKSAMRGLEAPFYTCEAVLTEAHFLLSARTHNGAARLNELVERGKIEVPFSFMEHRTEVTNLMKRFGDVPMSFADACLVQMATLEPATIITTDGGFEYYRGKDGKRLALVSP